MGAITLPAQGRAARRMNGSGWLAGLMLGALVVVAPGVVLAKCDPHQEAACSRPKSGHRDAGPGLGATSGRTARNGEVLNRGSTTGSGPVTGAGKVTSPVIQRQTDSASPGLFQKAQ